MHFPQALVLSLFAVSATAQTLPSLIDALKAAGSSKFAALIQSDPSISAIYLSNQVQTVFAPTDDTIGDSFATLAAPSRMGKRQSLTPQQQQALLIHATQQQSNINTLRTLPGSVVGTKDSTANLGGRPQAVVSDPRNTTSSSSKRWSPSVQRRHDNSSSVPLVNIFSGLGNHISIIGADIPYDGGLIQSTNGLFTLPGSLSSTAKTTGQTTFASLASSANLTDTFDKTPFITIFIPSNAAFAAANQSTPSAGTAALLKGHVLPNFAGYLPSLLNGATFPTLAGTTLTVTIKGSDYYVNGAKIVSSNLIVGNGVAHVIDTVLTPPTTVFTGAASSLPTAASKYFAAVLSVALVMAWSF